MAGILFLGLDYSTQQLKSLIYDGLGELIDYEFIEYDSDLAAYGTTNGVYHLEDTIVAPSAMWIEATDILFERLSIKFDLSKIVALSGSAQQHTTMFWATGSNDRLSNLDPNKHLSGQIENIFSRPLSPTWMDSSTAEDCKAIENIFGGKLAFQTRIGSSLANRFSGPQILKAFKSDGSLENLTEAITLVSNGMCSIFAGRFVGMDMSDSAGTGLQKCGSLCWDTDICLAISSNLQSKLGGIIRSNSVPGYLSDYFVKRYSMNPHCKVVAFTGDNPSSVVGMQLNKEDLCLSLGTSDTLFSCLSMPPIIVPNIPLFVFPHPLSEDTFVTLLCYKNGARVRQRLCHEHCADNWALFSQLLEATCPGNDGILGLLYDDEEITPSGIRGRYFIDKVNKRFLDEKDVSAPHLVRALIEGQLLAKYFHFAAINPGDSIRRILVTGGASSNKEILQVASDVFNVPLYSVDVANSAALGSVIRAVLATQTEEFSTSFTDKVTALREVCQPDNYNVYKTIDKAIFDFS